jgi:hypothetical protein
MISGAARGYDLKSLTLARASLKGGRLWKNLYTAVGSLSLSQIKSEHIDDAVRPGLVGR